jgi:hypothetical protein
MDLPLWDESNFMGRGRSFALGIGTLKALSNSPAYLLLYSIFSRFFGTIKSIFFMKYFLTIGTTLSLFTFLIKNVRLFSISILLSFLWAMSQYNIRAVNMVYHFSVLVFMLSLIYCNKSRLVSILFLLLCVFIRLEYIFILIPYLVYSTIMLIKKNSRIKILAPENKSKSNLSLVIALLLVMLLTYISVNVTYWDIGVKRTWFAFKQQYALAQVETGRFNLNPFIDYNIILAQDFPSAHSLREAFLVNPSRFTHNALKNFLYLFKALTKFVIPYHSYEKYIPFVGLIFIPIVYIFLLKWKIFISHAKGIVLKLGDVYILLLIALLALIPSLMVYTRAAYSLMLMPMVFLYAGVLYKTLEHTGIPSAYLKRTIQILICLILVGVLRNPMPFGEKHIERPTYEAVVKLRQIWPSTKTKLLGVASSSYANYLGHEKCVPIELLVTVGGKDIKPDEKISLKDAITSFKPDAVLVNKILLSSRIFDKNSLSILNSEDYVMHVVGDGKIYFLKQK